MSITTSGCLLLNSAILSLTQASSEGNNKKLHGFSRISLRLTLSNWLDWRFFFSFLKKGRFEWVQIAVLSFRLNLSIFDLSPSNSIKKQSMTAASWQVDIYWARCEWAESDDSALNLKFCLFRSKKVETNGGVGNGKSINPSSGGTNSRTKCSVSTWCESQDRISPDYSLLDPFERTYSNIPSLWL